MKEQTYGWYPSAKNVYEDRRIDTLTPYQLEALYRYRDSKYYQPPMTPPEERTSRVKSRTSSKQSEPNIKPRVKSAPIHTTYKPPPRLNLPTPQQCWSTHVPETEITVLPSQPSPAPFVSATMPRETTPQRSVSCAQSLKVQSPFTAGSPSNAQKIARIKSATCRRETPTKPQRPVKSAGPIRPSPSPARSVSTHQTPVQQSYAPEYEHTNFDYSWPQPSYPINIDDIPAPSGIQIAERPPSGRMSVPRMAPSPVNTKRSTSSQRKTQNMPSYRPHAPSPYKMDLYLEEEDDYQGRCETPDYDEEANRHGWMMEVHGDPLKIKKVSRRLPYTVKVDEPETERDPPGVHMENNETFFLNTIPRRPYTFAIDKEWISEVIHQKRMEMQKKHGINHRYKNFAFVY